MDVIHTAIWVADADRTIEFYRDGLGLDLNWEFTADGVRNVYLGGEHGELQFKHEQDGDHPVGTAGGLDHVAVGVDDADAVFERVTERTDCPVVEGPTTMEEISRRVAFVEDPDGYVVELVERV
ncbi:VOC family protein [Haloferacaceae archaeon DSL9]